MQWFEPIIAIGAILLVVLPIVSKIYAIKKGKPTCDCGCSDCKSDCPMHKFSEEDKKEIVKEFRKVIE